MTRHFETQLYNMKHPQRKVQKVLQQTFSMNGSQKKKNVLKNSSQSITGLALLKFIARFRDEKYKASFAYVYCIYIYIGFGAYIYINNTIIS